MNAYLSLTAAPSRSTLCFFQESILHFQFSVAAFEFPQPGAFGQFQRRLVGRGVARYFFTQPPTVVSLSPYSRDTSAIDRVVSTTSLATSSRNSGLYLSYFPANSLIPFRIGPYSVRSPEGWRHAGSAVGRRRD